RQHWVIKARIKSYSIAGRGLRPVTISWPTPMPDWATPCFIPAPGANGSRMESGTWRWGDVCPPLSKSPCLQTKFPVPPVLSFYKIVGRLKIGDLHIFSIPQELFATGI